MASISHWTRRSRVLPARIKGIREPVYLRVPSSDLRVFQQVVLDQQYNLPTRWEPTFIVDAGANIGLTTIVLAKKFPNARIVALEPDKDNFGLLQRNLKRHPNVTPILGALWSENSDLIIVNADAESWGFRVGNAAGDEPAAKRVKGFTISSLMRQFGVSKIDILKIDIEGSELEVFETSAEWIDQVDSMLVVLHDRYRPGCSRPFYAVSETFEHEWVQGELVCVARKNGCLIPVTSRG